MPTLSIYDMDNNATYNMSVNLASSFTSTKAAATQEGQGIPEYYLTITTNIPNPEGGNFPTYYIKTLEDIPPGYPTATSFDELVRYYLEYFQSISIYESSSSESSSSSSSSSSNGISSDSSDSSDSSV